MNPTNRTKQTKCLKSEPNSSDFGHCSNSELFANGTIMKSAKIVTLRFWTSTVLYLNLFMRSKLFFYFSIFSIMFSDFSFFDATSLHSFLIFNIFLFFFLLTVASWTKMTCQSMADSSDNRAGDYGSKGLQFTTR